MAGHIRDEVRLRNQFDYVRGKSRTLQQAYDYSLQNGLDSETRQIKHKDRQRKSNLEQLRSQIDLHRQKIKDLRKHLGFEKRVEQEDVETDWKWLFEDFQQPVLELGVFDEHDEY